MAIVQSLTGSRCQFITVSELAHYWHVSERTIYRHIEKGALRITRVGPHGRVRIGMADALNYGHPNMCDSCDIRDVTGQDETRDQ